MNRVSFRVRSALIISLAFVIFLISFFALSYFAVRNSLLERGDKEVREQIQLILSHLRFGSSPEESSAIASSYGTTGEAVLAVKIYNKQSNTTLSLTGPRVAADALANVVFPVQTDYVVIETDTTTYRCFRSANEHYEVSAAMNTRVLQETEQAMLMQFAVLLLIGTVVSWGIGYLVAGYSLRPFQRLLHAARRIEHEPPPSQSRLPVTQRVRELAELSGTMNAILNTRDANIVKLSAFTADVSHELRTPLTTMKGELEVELKLQPESEVQRMLLGSLLEEVERLIAIVEDLLLLSEIEQEKKVSAPTIATCELLDVIRSLADRTKRIAAERQLGFVVNNELAEGKELAIPPVRFERMIFNVLLNAINFTPACGTIELDVRSRGSHAILRIRDTGKGIAPEDLTHIFDRFWRAEHSRNRSFGGAGLGLAITESIAKRYNIGIDIESEPGKGTTVTFTLPSSLVV